MPFLLTCSVKWILSHTLRTHLQQSVTHQRGGWKAKPLMEGNVEVGLWDVEGDIMALTIKLLSGRPLLPTGGVRGRRAAATADTELVLGTDSR